MHLYTPDNTGPTGLTVVSNAPGMMPPPPPAPASHPTTFPAPANPPNTQVLQLPKPPAIQGHGPVTWAGAPAVESAAPAFQASADTGNRHSWDLTTEVGAWVTRNQTNTGITLEGSSLPIQIASPFDPANPDPATTPYLDVTLAKPSATQGGVIPNSVGLCTSNCTYYDGSTYPIGVNGENDPSAGGSPTSMNLMNLARGTLNVGLYRFSAEANLAPSGQQPTYIPVVPCTGFTFSPSLWQGAYIQMQNAYAENLVPVLVFQQQTNACFDSNGNETTDWFDLLQYFSYYMPNFGYVCVGSGLFQDCGTNPPMYFEIGNEPDLPVGSKYASKWNAIYLPFPLWQYHELVRLPQHAL